MDHVRQHPSSSQVPRPILSAFHPFLDHNRSTTLEHDAALEAALRLQVSLILVLYQLVTHEAREISLHPVRTSNRTFGL